MRKVDTSYLSQNECWGDQINGLKHCQNCKWIGISACEGKDIRLTSHNSKGFRIGENGMLPDEYKREYDQSLVIN